MIAALRPGRPPERRSLIGALVGCALLIGLLPFARQQQAPQMVEIFWGGYEFVADKLWGPEGLFPSGTTATTTMRSLECPALTPRTGDSCSGDVTCSYDFEQLTPRSLASPTVSAACIGGRWEVSIVPDTSAAEGFAFGLPTAGPVPVGDDVDKANQFLAGGQVREPRRRGMTTTERPRRPAACRGCPCPPAPRRGRQTDRASPPSR